MSKVIFGIVLLLTISSATQALKIGTDIVAANTEVLKCFGEVFEKAIGSEIIVNRDFAKEVTDFLMRADPSILAANSQFKDCVAKFPSADVQLASCNSAVATGKCELLNNVLIVKPCPAGYARLQESSTSALACYQACPEGFVANGPLCQKPNTYVLSPFRNELECMQANNGKPCSIYHVRYFVPDCRENFYRLGSTVCIPKCPRNTEDHETFCLRPSVKAPVFKLLDLSSN